MQKNFKEHCSLKNKTDYSQADWAENQNIALYWMVKILCMAVPKVRYKETACFTGFYDFPENGKNNFLSKPVAFIDEKNEAVSMDAAMQKAMLYLNSGTFLKLLTWSW